MRRLAVPVGISLVLLAAIVFQGARTTGPAVYERSLAGAATLADHVTLPLMRGTFVPQGETAEVTVEVDATVSGLATQNLTFAYGRTDEPGTTLLTGRGAADGYLIDGARDAYVGVASASSPDVGRTFEIDGLEPGATYTWALHVATVGAFEPLELGAGAQPVDLSFDATRRRLFVANGDRVEVVTDLGVEAGTSGHMERGEPIDGLDNVRGVAGHPNDPDIVYVSHEDEGDAVVAEIDVDRRRALRRFEVGGTPGWIEVTPDGRKLYAKTSTTELVPVSLEDGDVGEPIELPPEIGHMTTTPDSRWLFVPSIFGNQITRISTSTDRVSGVLSAGSDSGPVALVMMPSGEQMWVAEAAADRLREIDVTGFRFTPSEPVEELALPASVAASPSGRSLIAVGGDDEAQTWWSVALPSSGAVHETVWNLASTSVAILDDPDGPSSGDIYAVGFTDGLVMHWHASRLDVEDGAATVRIEGAEAGPGDDQDVDAPS